MSKLVQVDLNLQTLVQNYSSLSNLVQIGVQYWFKLVQIHLNFIYFRISGKRIAKVVGISIPDRKEKEELAVKNAIGNQRITFSGYFFSILDICFIENNFLT